ncbi:anti-sigma factor family protein [Tautonia sociabilis]|nr:zf-HC2 domain-containing protein [Tautonia sociabilis]
MSQFDETLLSAYLDDELDPESRREVEEAMRADPRLSRELGELARVRGLVEGLRRPLEAPDVSGEVLARIALERAPTRALPPIAAASALAAAALLVLFFLGSRPHRAEPPRGGPVEVAGADVPEQSGSGTVAIASVPDRDDSAEGLAGFPEVAEGGPAVGDADRAGAGDGGLLGFVLDLIDYPEGEQFEIEPAPGTSAEELAAGLDVLLREQIVRLDPRYALIHTGTSPGPGAIAFALVARPSERQTLLSLIEEALGARPRKAGWADREEAAGMLVAEAGGLTLSTATTGVPMRRELPDRIHAIPVFPQDSATSPEPGELGRPLPGGLPPVSVAPPAAPVSPLPEGTAPEPTGPDSGAEPERPGVILLWVRDAAGGSPAPGSPD